MTTHCPACHRVWPQAPGCPCLDDGTPPANEPDCPICHHQWPGLAYCSRCGPACQACAITWVPEPPEPVTSERAPMGCLGAVLLLVSFGVGWGVVQGVYQLGRLLGVWP
jgi:hypothetical protein